VTGDEATILVRMAGADRSDQTTGHTLTELRLTTPGETGAIYARCDCGASTHLGLSGGPGDGPGTEEELAFTCGGCDSVYWFTVTIVSRGGGPC
jgi:hypothetical protein